MILFFDKVINKIRRSYRCRLFRAMTGNKAVGLKIKGSCYLMNRNIKVGKNLSLYPDVQFFGNGPIVIGDNVQIGNGVCIYASSDAGVTIGNDVAIGAYTYIIDADHGIELGEKIAKQKLVASPIVIEDDVWLAQKVTVLKGCKIQEGAVVGANALVNKNIESYGIAVGIPAKVIKHRGEPK